MKSIRLNANIRQKIVANVMAKYKEANQLPEVNEESPDEYLSDAVWQRSYGHLDLSNIPKGMLYENSFMRVRLSGESTATPDFPRVNGEAQYRPVESPKYIQATPEEEAEYRRLAKIRRQERQKRNEAAEAMAAFESDVSTAINSCNTTGQLVELWPEVQEFIPQNIQNPSSINLPTVSTAALNAALTK